MRLIKSMMVAVMLGLGGLSQALAVTVPVHPPTVQSAAAARLNINTATVKELKGVPGLNVNKARAIVAYRKLNGPFSSLETLQKVSGFKRMDIKKLQELKEHFILS